MLLFQSELSGDAFSIEVPQNLLRTKEYSKNISSGKEFPFESGSKLLRTFFWCLYRKGVAIHAYLIFLCPENRAIFSTFWANFLTKLHREPGEKRKNPLQKIHLNLTSASSRISNHGLETTAYRLGNEKSLSKKKLSGISRHLGP